MERTDLEVSSGLGNARHTFTKLMKPIVALLRKLGIRIVIYLDDMLIVARIQEEACQHFATIVIALCFVINMEKSITIHTQTISTISLPGRKLHALRKLARRQQFWICQGSW